MRLKLDYEEIYKYLGYKKEVPEETILNSINNCTKTISQITKNSYTYNIFDLEQCLNNNLMIKKTNSELKGKSISKHLKNCNKIILMAVTLGIEIDRKIKLLQMIDITEAFILNAVATEYLEKLCDYVEIEIKEKYSKEKYFTSRFSPGYGDLDIYYQLDIRRLLNTNIKIGLTVTPNGISIPSKSVTAIIGASEIDIYENKRENKNKCDNCNLINTCDFKK